jgi:2-polyprenyl-6-methoxyphenol hydroxylase-like FAD-dependent oxidoreductase
VPSTDAPRVLIAGAGPTGLVLALNLARRGVRFRLISEAAGPGEQSRAMALQARTLEFYRQLGFAEEIIRDGVVVEHAHFRESYGPGQVREIFKLRFGDLGAGISPYPFVLTYPQDDHEHFLVRKLAELGVAVEWNSRLTGFSQDADGVTASLAGPNGEEQMRAEYLCGCDGAHSVVRETLGLGFAGRTYEQLFFVCDAKVAGEFGLDLYATLGEYALLLMFPVRSSRMHRLIGLVPRGLSQRDNITFDTIRDQVEPMLSIKVTEVNWFSTYRVHHRVAERFRGGRAFILGDAAHIHSPAGGQGMNTGIGDATNLAWKIADVVRGRASPAVLDTYEQDRVGFAHALVATTDRGFTAIVAPGFAGALVRRIFAPAILWAGTKLPSVRHALFRVVSQTRIRYPDSALSEGHAGGVRGGDRLPWVGTLDNYAPLRSLDWQLHAYGALGAQLRTLCERLAIPVQVFAWNAEAQAAGFARDATYLVRPDGYVALALDGDDAARLQSYVARAGLSFGAT